MVYDMGYELGEVKDNGSIILFEDSSTKVVTKFRQ